MSLSKTAAATLAALALTAAMAWPVVVAPSSRIFGNEIVGRHHDPFSVMWRFEYGAPPAPYRQPLVDDAGQWLARGAGPIAAYNVLVLITFPLTVLTTFLLARYLKLSTAGAATAAFAFAFAPPHLAHAAYHPHIAQTQWLPLYFLALWAWVRRPSWLRAALLAAAAAALALSNFYFAFIAAVLTPIAAAAAWATWRSGRARQAIAVFAGLAAAGLAAAALARAAAPRLFSDTSPFAFPRADLARYGAQWRAYFVPPVEHPLWGGGATDFWASRGMSGAVIEQQVSVSWALLVLALVAVWCWIRARRAAGDAAPASDALRPVPMLAAVALAAAVCGLAPPPGTGAAPLLAPATWLHAAAPMFRAYARFAFVAHLMLALLAGIGVMCLWRGGSGLFRRPVPAHALAAVLLIVAAVEYVPFPSRSRDVLPTAAHRWLASRPPPMRVLDCVQPSQGEALVPWLMKRELATLSLDLPSCAEPNIAQQAASLGYTYLIVRAEPGLPAQAPPGPGLELARAFEDANLYEVVAAPAPVIVAGIEGFSPTEQNAAESWRWMGQRGTWIVRNLEPRAVTVALDLELAAFRMPRRLTVTLDGAPAGFIEAGTQAARHTLGPWSIAPGVHRLVFTALEPATAAAPPDPRRLTVMLRDWRWRE